MAGQTKGVLAKLRKFTRYQAMTLIFFIVLAIIEARLFIIQIVDHKQYTQQADEMQTTKQTINAKRGQIYVRDTDGNIAPLVMNKTVYTLFADPSAIEDVDKVKELINRVVGSALMQDGVEQLTNKDKQYVVLAKQLTPDQAKEIKDANLYGLGLQADTQRVYPEGALAAQVLGFVNSDGEGQYGVEQYLNDELSGTPGVLQSITDVSPNPPNNWR